MLLAVDPIAPVFVESEYQSWHEKLFQLGVEGKVPFYDSIKSIKIRENTATVIHGNSSLTKVGFKKCYVFSDYRVSLENEMVSEREFPRTVYDFFQITKSEPHHIKLIEDSDDFVSKIVFYESGRLKNKSNTDIVTVSKIFSSNFLDFDFSDTSCKFKARKMIEEKGVLGIVNRVDKITNKVYRDRINLSFVERLVVNNDLRKYKASKHVKFPNKLCRVR